MVQHSLDLGIFKGFVNDPEGCVLYTGCCSVLTSALQEVWGGKVWRDRCKICAVEGRLPIYFSALFKRFCWSLSSLQTEALGVC